MSRLASLAEFAAWCDEVERKANRGRRVRVCTGTACRAAGALDVAAKLRDEIRRAGLGVSVVETGCQGFCEHGPLVTVDPEGVFYQQVRPGDAAKIADFTIRRGQVIDRLLYKDPASGRVALTAAEIPFFRHQTRLVLRGCGYINPASIEDYVATGGYRALARVLGGMRPEEVIAEVKESGLRGRGGAGFPTGRKWEAARAAAGSRKFVICNGDEGDPGAFIDRSLMEGDPHAIIEGMIICAYAIGNCTEGFIYVREEYPLAVEHLQAALDQARMKGLLGSNILGIGLDFDIEIKRGAGAFVCGESTALMYSIEGKRGMPRVTPPRSVEAGLWGLPTCLNNVETFANIPLIVEQGAASYARMGTGASKGTKIFALSGNVCHTGLIEVPMGVTVREIVFDVGGGIPGGKKFKAAQIGGPSGGCVPEKHLDMPVDFDSLKEIGSMMGSGGLVVVDEDTCAVQLARYFLSFTQRESCGKCPPCRIGTYQMLRILDRIIQGEGHQDDIVRLEKLGGYIARASLCGLGQSAPNPVLSTLRYFRDEYEAHIREKRCPAGACKSLMTYTIGDDCIRCGLCQASCPAGAVLETTDDYYIEETLCTRCGTCAAVCPADAVGRVAGVMSRG